ncbi:MAG: hypothetical protein ACI8UZ_003119, partial [Akkermansiaceae bacterium]
RLMLMAPEVGLGHLTKGGSLRLAKYDHVSWNFGGIALAIIAESRPDLVEKAVAPFVEVVARNVSTYNRDFTGPAECFVRVLVESAPIAWSNILTKIDPAVAENNLSECLKLDEDHRRTGAVVIESAIALTGSVGDMARRLRARFPKASLAPTDTPRLSPRRGRKRRKRRG